MIILLLFSILPLDLNAIAQTRGFTQIGSIFGNSYHGACKLLREDGTHDEFQYVPNQEVCAYLATKTDGARVIHAQYLNENDPKQTQDVSLGSFISNPSVPDSAILCLNVRGPTRHISSYGHAFLSLTLPPLNQTITYAYWPYHLVVNGESDWKYLSSGKAETEKFRSLCKTIDHASIVKHFRSIEPKHRFNGIIYNCTNYALEKFKLITGISAPAGSRLLKFVKTPTSLIRTLSRNQQTVSPQSTHLDTP